MAGNDIAGVTNAQSTPYACASVCTALPACVGFTWAGNNSVGGATCWPKSAAPALAASSTALFFARESALQTLVASGQSFSSIGYYEQYASDISSADNINSGSQTQATCAALCAATSNCVSLTVNNTNCWPKTASLGAAAGNVAGYVLTPPGAPPTPWPGSAISVLATCRLCQQC